MRISDWSSDVCSSDLFIGTRKSKAPPLPLLFCAGPDSTTSWPAALSSVYSARMFAASKPSSFDSTMFSRSEEHTSELQSLMRISYAVFCLKKKKITQNTNKHQIPHNIRRYDNHKY